LSMGGKLAMTLSSGLGGKSLSEMSAIQLAAYEGYMGLGGEQLMELRKVDRLMRGQWDTIQEGQKEAREAAKAGNKPSEETVARLKEMGVTLHDDGRATIKMKDGQEKLLDSFNDWTQSQGDVLENAVYKGMTQQEAMAKMTAENTASITNQIETGIQYILEKIYDVMQQLLSWTQGLDATERETRDKLIQRAESEEKTLDTLLEANSNQLREAQVARDTGNAEQKAAAEKQIAELQEQRKSLLASQDAARQQVRLLNTIEGAGVGRTKTEEQMLAEIKDRQIEENIDAIAERYGEEVAQQVREEIATKGAEAEAETKEAYDQAMMGGEAFDTSGKTYKQQVAEAKRGAASDVLSEYLVDPEEEADMIAIASGAVQAPLLVNQTKELTKAQKEDFDRLPGLTKEGYLEALKLKEQRQAAELIAGPGGDANAVLARIQSGERLLSTETAKLEAAGLTTAAHMWGTAGLAGGSGSQAPGEVPKPGELPTADKPSDFFFSRGIVTPIDQADQFFGAKRGGAIDKGGGFGGGGAKTVNITLNSPNPAIVYDTVRRAVKESR